MISKNKNYKLELSRTGLIIYNIANALTIRLDRRETERFLKKKVDFEKLDYFCEVAHLEISNTCNLQCNYCYVENKNHKELSTDVWKKILVNLANYGIFQVSFGGGEPTLREDLMDLARFTKELNMNLGMTTNGTCLYRWDPRLLKKYFNQINVSWHENFNVVNKALAFLKKNKIKRGINYTYSAISCNDNETVKDLAEKYNAELLYLVYKPVKKDIHNQILNTIVYNIAKESSNEGLKVAVDGPCVNKCLMKIKFVDIDSMGNVYPCSFMRKSMGSAVKEDFTNIWKNRGEQIDCKFVEIKKEKHG